MIQIEPIAVCIAAFVAGLQRGDPSAIGLAVMVVAFTAFCFWFVVVRNFR